MMPDNLIYVYCLSHNRPELQNIFGSENLSSLNFGDFYVVVKYVSESEFSEENFKRNLSNVDWLEANAREHVDVIYQIMENDTVIPFKFGTIFQAETSLGKFITDYSDSLIENFDHIKGTEEWSLKIYCDRKMFIERIDELSEEAAELEKQIMASSPGKAFLLKRKKADLTEKEMDRICKKFGQEYFNDFKTLSESTSLSNLLPKEFTGRQDTMILNASFLVKKSNVADFNNSVDLLKKKDANSGFSIETSGPWPPFSFISIKEK